MPRVTFTSDHHLLPSLFDSGRSSDPFERYHASPSDIDTILSRKLHDQLQASSNNEQSSCLKPLNTVDNELIELIDQFFRLAYLNTIPIVNLLATAVASNFLKENIRELDDRLQQQQQPQYDLHRRSSSLYNPEDDDDDLSWASAPA